MPSQKGWLWARQGPEAMRSQMTNTDPAKCWYAPPPLSHKRLPPIRRRFNGLRSCMHLQSTGLCQPFPLLCAPRRCPVPVALPYRDHFNCEAAVPKRTALGAPVTSQSARAPLQM